MITNVEQEVSMPSRDNVNKKPYASETWPCNLHEHRLVIYFVNVQLFSVLNIHTCHWHELFSHGCLVTMT